jgi:hypothetical protein
LIRLNPWLLAYYQRLRAAGKRPKVAMIAAMHKLLAAIYSIAVRRRPSFYNFLRKQGSGAARYKSRHAPSPQ